MPAITGRRSAGRRRRRQPANTIPAARPMRQSKPPSPSATIARRGGVLVPPLRDVADARGDQPEQQGIEDQARCGLVLAVRRAALDETGDEPREQRGDGHRDDADREGTDA